MEHYGIKSQVKPVENQGQVEPVEDQVSFRCSYQDPVSRLQWIQHIFDLAIPVPEEVPQIITSDLHMVQARLRQTECRRRRFRCTESRQTASIQKGLDKQIPRHRVHTDTNPTHPSTTPPKTEAHTEVGHRQDSDRVCADRTHMNRIRMDRIQIQNVCTSSVWTDRVQTDSVRIH